MNKSIGRLSVLVLAGLAVAACSPTFSADREPYTTIATPAMINQAAGAPYAPQCAYEPAPVRRSW